MQIKKISIFILLFAIIVSINGIAASECNVDNLNSVNSSDQEFICSELNFNDLKLAEYELSDFKTEVGDVNSDEKLSSISDNENSELYESDSDNPTTLVENFNSAVLLNSESNYSKIIYVGQNNVGDGDGSLENPFSTLDLACGSVNGESNVLLNIFNGTYLLGSELKFNTSDLTIRGISGNVIIKAENPTTRGYYRAFELTDSTGNFTMNNIIFDSSDYTQGVFIYDPTDRKYKYRSSFLPFYGNANMGIFNNCTFKGFNKNSITGWTSYKSLFSNCIFDGFNGDYKVFYDSKMGAMNGAPTFKNCIFLNINTLTACYYPETTNCSFIDCWFGQNELPSFLYVGGLDSSGHSLLNVLLPVYSYAVFSVSENYLGNNQYEILGKLTWNGTDNQDGMENFHPMTVKLSSTTGDIVENVTLTNGNFRAVYTSSNPTHKVTAVLDNEELDLEFATVNITTASPSITYGQDQNVTITFTQAINSNVTISVNNKTYIVKVNDSDSFTFTIPDVLNQGTYTVNVTLSDESNKLYGSNSTELTVSKVTEYLFDAPQPAENPKVGDKVTIPVELPQDATGNVTVYVGETPFVKDAAQNVDVEIDGLVAGENKITVVYSGNDKYETKTLEFNITAEKVSTESNSTSTSSNSTTSADTQKQSSTSSAKKAKATKITAKKKTFKAKKKVKKYTITLKAGKKAVKKVWVTLKIKGKKIIKAKTNAKGKATFKIKKLTKKGKYSAVIKFKGNKNYKASSKKVKIVIK